MQLINDCIFAAKSRMPDSPCLLIETQYFPPIQFFKKACEYPVLLLEAYEHYQKGAYRNRCGIAGPNGLQRLSVPLIKGKNAQAPIRDVRIFQKENWQIIHWRSIQTAYSKSPFFEFYVDEVKPIFEKKWTFLFDLNLEIINTIKDILQLPFEVECTSHFNKSPEKPTFDFRNCISPKNKMLPAELESRYPQVFEAKNGFLANLSILDLLFCVGPESLYYLDPE